MEDGDHMDVLLSLLAESRDAENEQNSQEQIDDLDGLFDNDDEDGSEYKESVEEEEGDEKPQEDNDGESGGEESAQVLNRSRDELQEELKRMQEQMMRLQQQLELTQKASSSVSSTAVGNSGSVTSEKPTASTSRARSGPTGVVQNAPSQKSQAAASKATPGRRESTKLQESADFSTQLSNADSFKRKPRVAHQAKASTLPDNRGALVEIKVSSSFQPSQSAGEDPSPLRSPTASQSRSTGQSKPHPPPPIPKDVAVEKFSGLRLRKPRVSSCEMENKMAGRRLIRLSQVPERLAREKLEDCDWVTFAVLINKVTPQSSNSGKTFSIWKLNDLHNLEVYVSLLLFGEVHKELWKTEPGTVIGILNPNPLKQKDGYDGVSLTVDNAHKILVLGEAQDYGTCKAMKKNGDPCSQIVNMYECQYCQYHVKAQYKKMSAKRADLQSSFSGKAPNTVKGKNAGSLRERLCQDGFYYGGVSSAACAASLSTSKPNKPTTRTIDSLFRKGAAELVEQAKRLAMESGRVSGCSDEFKSLMSMPTPGALQLKKHLAHGGQQVSQRAAGTPVQSISAADLLKEQKRKQKELWQNRQRRGLQSSPPVMSSSQGQEVLTSPRAAPMVPSATRSPTGPHTPKLGRGLSEGEDIVFFENSLPPPKPSTSALSSAKMAALRKLRAKGVDLQKEDPNATKRKRADSSEINTKVEKNRASPSGGDNKETEEPAQKRRREELDYMQSEEFQKILNAKSRHAGVLQAAEFQMQETYFNVLVKKEQMEEKMNSIREMKCRAVTCRKCKYTYFTPADRCVAEKHDLRWHDALKRFFKCPCGQRAIALDKLPHKHCSHCGLFKWERAGMLKEKTGPKIAGELLLPRGEEHGKFLNSMK